jgi:SAM-dependent methyltransferase
MTMENQFPLLYHIHHNHHDEDIPFWLSLAAEHGSPVLELGCGTGRVLFPLIEAGFTAFGLDCDIDMLRFAQTSFAEQHGYTAPVFLADLAAFHLAVACPLVIMPCNTLSTLSSQARLACFSRVCQHLSPAGIFVASLPNPRLLRELPAHGEPELEEELVDPVGSGPLLISSEWNRLPDRFVVSWYYDRLSPQGEVHRLTFRVEHDLASREDYIDEMRQAGLQEIASYGDFDGGRYHASSPDLILIARKLATASF